MNYACQRGRIISRKRCINPKMTSWYFRRWVGCKLVLQDEPSEKSIKDQIERQNSLIIIILIRMTYYNMHTASEVGLD